MNILLEQIVSLPMSVFPLPGVVTECCWSLVQVATLVV